MLKLHLIPALLCTFTASASAQDAKPAANQQISRSVISQAREFAVTSRGPKTKLARTLGSSQYRQVRCGLQDQSGTLWFGTAGEGIYRYDGKGFTQYIIEDGPTSKLNSNVVWSILEDRKGRIWFGTDSGLARWDGKGIRRVPISSGLSLPGSVVSSPSQLTLAPTTVWSMLEDKRGTIWFGTNEGVFCCKDDVITPFLDDFKVQNASQLHLKMVDDILEDRQGNIWLASGMPPGLEGLCRFDGTSLTHFKPGGEQWIRTLVEDARGTLWLGTRHQGVWSYDGKTFSRFTKQEGLGTPLMLDRSGNVWFSGEENKNGLESRTGIWRYDGKEFRNFTVKDGLGKYGVWCIFEDRDGHIWVGTRNMGLYRYDGKSFTSFSE